MAGPVNEEVMGFSIDGSESEENWMYTHTYTHT